MKYLIACLFAFGVFTTSFAQTETEKNSPCLTCFYIDDNTFQCDVAGSEDGVTKEEWKHEEDMSKGDPSLREDDALDTEDQGEIESEDDVFNDPSVRDQDLYRDESEIESDEGILEDDAEIDEGDAGTETDPSVDEDHHNFMY
jgi:hypothetical protein